MSANWFRLSVNLPGYLQTEQELNHTLVLTTSLLMLQKSALKHYPNPSDVVIIIQWGKKVFSQPPIVQVLPLKKMREACHFHHRYTSAMTDKIRINVYLFLLLFSPQFCGIQLFSSYYLVSSLQLPYGLGRDEGRKPCVLRNTTKQHCFLTQRASNPEASRTNVSKETPCTWRPG